MFKRRRDETETSAPQAPAAPPQAQSARQDAPLFPPRPVQAKAADTTPSPSPLRPVPTKEAQPMPRPPNSPLAPPGPPAPAATAVPARPVLPANPPPGQPAAGAATPHSQFQSGPTGLAQRPALQDKRVLVVGRGISLQGSIKDAERLVVEGTIEADILHVVEIAIQPGGVFKGEIEADDAEIAGVIDGVVTARSSLVVRGSGRVVGSVRCRRLQVEEGGQISGKIEMITDGGSA